MWIKAVSWLLSNWHKIIMGLIVIGVCALILFHFKTYNETVADRNAKIVEITELKKSVEEKKKQIETQQQIIEQERSLRSEITAIYQQQQQAVQTRTIIRERIVNAPTTVSEQDTPLANDPALLDAARSLRDHQTSNRSGSSESSSPN